MTDTGRPPAPRRPLSMTSILALVAVAQGILFVSVGHVFALPSRDDTWLGLSVWLIVALLTPGSFDF